MAPTSLFAYAYLVGIAFSACTTLFAELVVQRPAGMREPFVTSDHVLRSIALVALAGPYLSFCEVAAAREEGAISALHSLAALAVINAWALALGVVLVETMTVLTLPL
jgi:hypothetical protein